MFLHGGMAAPRTTARVDSDAFMIVEYLDHAVRQPDIDLLANQAMRHGIESVEHIDMVIGMHLGLLPFGAFEGFRGKLAQGGAFDVFE